jgi:hypothetical protein
MIHTMGNETRDGNDRRSLGAVSLTKEKAPRRCPNLKGKDNMTPKERRQWQEMLVKSHEPRGCWEPDDPLLPTHQQLDREDKIMWKYKQMQIGADFLYVVGWYDPKGEWHADLSYSSREDAAARVHYLNGGGESEGEKRK